MDQIWFEMPEIRRSCFEKFVWIPLRAKHTIEEENKYGHLGFKYEYFQLRSLAVPFEKKKEVEKLGWNENSGQHSGYIHIQTKAYIPSTQYCGYGIETTGEHLVLEQNFNKFDKNIWHLNQDIVLTLGLLRENDTWVRPSEGYLDIVKLYRNKDGSPYCIDIRATHLKDYLCAREMALYITSYRDRRQIYDDVSHISWPENPFTQNNDNEKWQGRVTEIYEGGMPFGERAKIFHVGRTDPNLQDDVPELEPIKNENINSSSWIKEGSGSKLFNVEGKLWRNEWINPAPSSPLIRGDEMPSTIYFTTGIDGKQENKETLIDSDKWLWFRPEVMNTLLSYRGSELEWFTRNTGNISCSPGDNIPFGINSVGLINVYAKHIAQLSDWQQKIWAGFNRNPEGGVSNELLDSQMRVSPAITKAPEQLLAEALDVLNNTLKSELNIELLRTHAELPRILRNVHRFRVINKESLFALAKDIVRLTADSFDTKAIKKFITHPEKKKWRSLKMLQALVEINTDEQKAKNLLGPLVGIYDLRLSDSHLPSSDLKQTLDLVGVNSTSVFLEQGFQLLDSCVSSLQQIAQALKGIGQKCEN